MPTDFLRVSDLGASALTDLLSRAEALASDFAERKRSTSLGGRRVAWIWDGEGFRNRAAFELAASMLGAESIEIPVRVGEGDTPGDLGRYLDNWFDLIVVRTPSFERLAALAEAAGAPVVNARTRHNHPCEILGDLAFVRSQGCDLEELHLVFVGESSNVAHSWFEAAAAMPIRVTQVSPPGYEVDAAWFRSLVAEPKGEVRWTSDLATAISSADVIYTDCWPSGSDAASRDRIRAEFLPLQVTADVLDLAPRGSMFLPCPPVTRGQEVSATAMEHSACRVYEAKHWLLPVQAALMELLLT